MKGVVFTEFLGFVAERFGDDMVDDLVEACALDSQGAYTTVGTYDPAELMALCGALSARSGQPVPALVKAFGERLSESFAQAHPVFFERAASLFDFLESVEDHIHVEVRKLYPDAELPSFEVESRSPSRLTLVYRSPRRLGPLTEGLIHGSARHFGTPVQVHAEALGPQDALATRFVIELA